MVPVACPQGKSFEMILWLPILAKMFRNNVYDQENEKRACCPGHKALLRGLLPCQVSIEQAYVIIKHKLWLL